MKKLTYFFLIICLLLICPKGNTQNAFYDAIKLSKMASDTSPLTLKRNADVLKILSNYVPDSIKDKADSIINAFKQLPGKPQPNPFFQISGGTQTIPGFTADLERLGASIGGIDVTNIADGIAQFLIKRGKAELDIAFFQKMKDFINANAICKTLFPATGAFLNNIESYQYSELLQSLREAFQKDLNNLVINLNQLINLPAYSSALPPEARTAVRTAGILTQLSQTRKSIKADSLISQLAGLNEWKQIDSNLNNGWKLLNLLSTSLISTEADLDHSWITFGEFNTLLGDPVGLQIYFGLLYQKAGDIQFNANNIRVKFRDYLDSNKNKISMLAGGIENFLSLANSVDKTLSDYNSKKLAKTLTGDDYYTYINTVIDMLDYGFKMADVIRPGVENDDVIIIAKNASDLFKNISTKNYNAAVFNVAVIAKKVFILTNNPKDTAITDFIFKYGNLMASIIKAQSADDIEKAIESAALPVGSYSIKQNSACNISLNGYVGYALDFLNLGKNLHSNGIYAPIGFTFSTSFELWRKNRTSLSLFASFIDVGNIVSYRLSNGVTDSLKQEIRLESIFSPSLQGLIQFPKTPITLCAGWRMTPKLFYTKQNGFTTFDPKSVFNLSFLIDIPIFTLHNKALSTK